MLKGLGVVVAAVALGGCGSGGDPAPVPVASTTRTTATATTTGSTGATGGASDPAAIAAGLTPAQLVGERLVASFRGTTVPPPALLARIRRGELAGVLLFGENAPTAAAAKALVGKLQAIPRPGALKGVPLLILIDQEGGEVRRLSDAPPARSALAAARAGSASGVEADGRRTAAALKAAGITVDLAPVADVPRPGSALLAEERTYGTTRAQVRRYAPAFTRGLVAGGVAATAKHFPGFGEARVNTDTAAATIRLPLSALRSTDEAASHAVVQAGARLVMLANAIYPALDASHPATLSRRIATTELRDHVGFTGVSITDDLQAGALTRYGGPGTLAVASARAGADLLLFGSSEAATESAAAALLAAQLPRADQLAAATRVVRLRQQLAG